MAKVRFYVLADGRAGLVVDDVDFVVGKRVKELRDETLVKRRQLVRVFNYNGDTLTPRYFALLLYLALRSSDSPQSSPTIPIADIRNLPGWKGDDEKNRRGFDEFPPPIDGGATPALWYTSGKIHWHVDATFEFDTDERCRAYVARPAAPSARRPDFNPTPDGPEPLTPTTIPPAPALPPAHPAPTIIPPVPALPPADPAPTIIPPVPALPPADPAPRSVSRPPSRRATPLFLLLPLLLVGSAAGFAYRWSIAPPCLPMDAQCLWNGEPSFDPRDAAILVEQQRFEPGVDLPLALDRLRTRVATWRADLLETLAKEDPTLRSHIPQVPVVAVHHVDKALVARSGALLGISGALELQSHPERGHEYFLRDVRIILNLHALSRTNDHRTHLYARLSLPAHRSAPPGTCEQFYDYRQGQIALHPVLLNSIFGGSVTPPDATIAFAKCYEHMTNATDAGGGRLVRPQNLNFSAGSPLGPLASPLSQEAPIPILDVEALPQTELRYYLLPALILRATVDQVFPDGFPHILAIEKHTPLPPMHPEAVLSPTGRTVPAGPWPPLFEALRRQFIGDVRFASFFDPGEAGKWDFHRAPPDRWQQLLAADYGYATLLPSPFAVSLHILTARLMYLKGDDDSAFQSLERAANISIGPDHFKLLHTQLDYLSASTGPDLTGEAIGLRLQRSFELLEDLDSGGHTAIAAFERGRLSILDCPLDGHFIPEEQLRTVLKQRPKHLLTRFLLAKLLAMKDPSSSEVAALLRALLQDIALSHGQYSEDLHSLGPVDDVHYSVDPTYVLDDLVAYALTRCETKTMTDAIAIGRTISAVDWTYIKDTLLADDQNQHPFSLFPCPAIGLVPRPAWRHNCPSHDALVGAAIQQIDGMAGRVN